MKFSYDRKEDAPVAVIGGGQHGRQYLIATFCNEGLAIAYVQSRKAEKEFEIIRMPDGAYRLFGDE